MNLLLCGMPRSGKTTLGRELARKLGWQFMDTDAQLVVKSGLSCRELFTQNGEDHFRLLETEVLSECLSLQHHVIALGGGTLQREENRHLAKQIGLVCYLEVTIPTLEERLAKESTPPFLTKSLVALANERIPYFENIADITLQLPI